jgi:hypothetical protein
MPQQPLTPEPYDLYGATYTEHTLHMVKLGVRHVISDEVAATMRLDWARAELVRGMVAQLSAYVLADQLAPATFTGDFRAEFRAYATWRDHWKASRKDSWWMRLILRRWPIQRKLIVRPGRATVLIDRKVAYPQARISMPQLGRPLRIAQPNPMTWEFGPQQPAQ